MASCRLADLAPSKILEYLYLGAQKDATERKELERLHVGFVLNVTDTCPNYFEDSLVYKQIRVKVRHHCIREPPSPFSCVPFILFFPLPLASSPISFPSPHTMSLCNSCLTCVAGSAVNAPPP